MSYYKILGFEREPFSTSPDPDFFFLSKEHESSLTNTLIELNLRRGLSVILGDIGTGKTTLSRKLVQELGKREQFIFQIILNPLFESEKQFMHYLIKAFHVPYEADAKLDNLMLMRDAFEKYLLNKTLDEGKTVILIIDEAQKLTQESLETLRILLNYETNEFKLIQIVLLGQMELFPLISKMENFYDRISFKFTLYPFNLEETKQMIHYRVQKAGFKSKTNLFLEESIKDIYEFSNGYPRRITMLCHKLLKQLIIKNKYVVDSNLVKSVIEEEKKIDWQQESLT